MGDPATPPPAPPPTPHPHRAQEAAAAVVAGVLAVVVNKATLFSEYNPWMNAHYKYEYRIS